MPLRDIGGPHAAACSRALLGRTDWELFDHAPYVIDIAPSYNHLLTYLKKLGGIALQRFNSNELMESVETWLSSRAAHTDSFPEESFRSGGDYVEK